MKIIITATTVLTGLAALSYASMGEVLASWPEPTGANQVNGIGFEGEYVWVKNRPAETRGCVKCTKAGSMVTEIGLPFRYWTDSYGLAFDGVYLWTIHHEPSGPVRYDFYAKYTTAGSVVKYFSAHPSVLYYTSVSLSWDGQYLWTDGRRSGQPKRAEKYTTAGSLVGTFAIAPNWNTAAGYYNHQLWTGGNDGYVYGMNIGASTLVGSFAAPGGSCRAVGFDGEYLWTADRNTPQYIYKVDIDVVDVNPGSFGKIKGIYR